MTEALLHHRIIPVIELDSSASAADLARALLQGGIGTVEITLRTPQGLAAIEAIARDVPGMLVGAGTVTTPDDARAAIDAGARYGVAPGTNAGVCEVFQKQELAFLPGVITPSEIETALAMGCSLLKFFPAQAAGGPGFLKAISGPYTHRKPRFCATGGIGPDSMNDYLRLPQVFAIGGSWIASKAHIANNDWDQISANAQAAIAQLEDKA